MSEENYLPPLADLTPTHGDCQEEQEFAEFIGPNGTEYYLDRFARLRDGSKVCWHWPSFFLTLGWLFYRKLWFLGLGYLLVLPVLFAIVLGLMGRTFGANGILAAFLAYLVFGFVVVPSFANWLYFAKATRKVNSLRTRGLGGAARLQVLSRSGGTNVVAAALVMAMPVFVTGLLAAVSLPAYHGYTARAQVMEGLALASVVKAAVAEYYRGSGSWPADNIAIGLETLRKAPGNYVESIVVDAGVIVITFSATANEAIEGGQLVLNPDADKLPAIEWICYSPDIAPKYLPAECRH